MCGGFPISSEVVDFHVESEFDVSSKTRNVLAWQIHGAYLFATRGGMNETCKTWMEKRRCLLRNFLWHKWTEDLMITKFPNTISSGKILTVVFSFSVRKKIPLLVVKSYVPCICHAGTFLVLLVMSPVHAIRVFVHPIYVWKQIHAWMQICSEWNEATLDGSQCLDLMYDQTLGWSYVIPPGMQRFDKQSWR
jgi:hypothetical protein